MLRQRNEDEKAEAYRSYDTYHTYQQHQPLHRLSHLIISEPCETGNLFIFTILQIRKLRFRKV